MTARIFAALCILSAATGAFLAATLPPSTETAPVQVMRLGVWPWAVVVP